MVLNAGREGAVTWAVADEAYRELGEAAWAWVLGQIREDDGPWMLRLARVMDHGLTAPVVDRPDQWWAVPARRRTVHSGTSMLL